VTSTPSAPPLSRSVITVGLVVGVLAVSTSAILARVAMGEDPGVTEASIPGGAPALAVAFWRTTLGAVVLAPLGWRAARRQRARPTGREHRWLALSGLALGLHFAGFQGALAMTTVASAVTLTTISPIFVALAGWWLLRERTGQRTWVGMILTIAGAVVIGAADLTGHELGGRALLGDTMALGAAVAIAGYLLVGRMARRRIPATTYSAIVFAWAGVVLLPICLLTGTSLGGFAPLAWLAMVGIVIGPQLLGHTVFNALLSSVSATTVAIVVLAEPVGAALLAWLVLDELPAGWFWLGAPLVLAGVAIALTARRAAAEAPPPT
jgi:drug/metabolite transporter (DMT)-like permease